MAVSIVFNNNRELILDGTTLPYVHRMLDDAKRNNHEFVVVKKNTIAIKEISWIREIKK